MERAQDLMTGQRRFHGNVGCLVVTNLTHHHDVRILPEDGAQRRSEIESDVVAHRNLIDARQLVLDRVLDRYDVVLRVVQLLQHRVERCRLAGTGRTGHENHSVRRVDRLLEFVERALVHAHLVDAAGEGRLIENTNDDLLAVGGRQNRDTQIHFLANHLDAEAPVLRHPAFGDIQASENLDARRDRELERLWRRFRHH